MACCLALTILFSGVYRAWRAITPARAERAFAPPARWPAPGDAVIAPTPAPGRDRTRPARNRIARACVVIGLAWFTSGLLVAHVLPVVEINSITIDLAFHASGLVLAAAGAVVLTGRRPLPRGVLA